MAGYAALNYGTVTLTPASNSFIGQAFTYSGYNKTGTFYELYPESQAWVHAASTDQPVIVPTGFTLTNTWVNNDCTITLTTDFTTVSEGTYILYVSNYDYWVTSVPVLKIKVVNVIRHVDIGFSNNWTLSFSNIPYTGTSFSTLKASVYASNVSKTLRDTDFSSYLTTSKDASSSSLSVSFNVWDTDFSKYFSTFVIQNINGATTATTGVLYIEDSIVGPVAYASFFIPIPTTTNLYAKPLNYGTVTLDPINTTSATFEGRVLQYYGGNYSGMGFDIYREGEWTYNPNRTYPFKNSSSLATGFALDYVMNDNTQPFKVWVSIYAVPGVYVLYGYHPGDDSVKYGLPLLRIKVVNASTAVTFNSANNWALNSTVSYTGSSIQTFKASLTASNGSLLLRDTDYSSYLTYSTNTVSSTYTLTFDAKAFVKNEKLGAASSVTLGTIYTQDTNTTAVAYASFVIPAPNAVSMTIPSVIYSYTDQATTITSTTGYAYTGSSTPTFYVENLDGVSSGSNITATSSAITVTDSYFTSAYLRSIKQNGYQLYFSDSVTAYRKVGSSFTIAQVSPVALSTPFELNRLNDWTKHTVLSGVDFGTVQFYALPVSSTNTQDALAGITFVVNVVGANRIVSITAGDTQAYRQSGGGQFNVHYTDGSTPLTAWQQFTIPSPTPVTAQNAVTLNRLNNWNATTPFTYNGSVQSTLLSYITFSGESERLDNVLTLATSGTSITYAINAKSVIQSPRTTAGSTLQLWLADDNTKPTVLGSFAIPRTFTAQSVTAPATVYRFANPVKLFSFLYTYSTELAFLVLREGDAATYITNSADASLLTTAVQNQAGLSLAVSQSININSDGRASINVSLDESVITNAFLRSKTTDKYQVYAYDNSTYLTPVGTAFYVQQPSLLQPVTSQTMTLNRLNNFSDSELLSGVDFPTVQLYVLPEGSSNKADSITLPYTFVSNTLSFALGSTNTYRINGGSFAIWYDDKYTYLEQWKTYTVPVPSVLSPLGPPSGTINRTNDWSITYANILYTGAVFSSLRAFVTYSTDASTELDLLTTQKNSGSSTISLTIDVKSIRRTDTAKTLQIWTEDDNTYKTLYATLTLPKVSVITSVSSSLSALSRLSTNEVCTGSYVGSAWYSFQLFIIKVGTEATLPLLTSAYGLSTSYINGDGDAFTASVSVDRTVYTNAYLRSNPNDAYQLYAYDDNTAPVALGSTTVIEPPSLIAPVTTDTIILNRLNSWTESVSYSNVDSDTVQFYILPGSSVNKSDAISSISWTKTSGIFSFTVPDTHTYRLNGGTFSVYYDDKYTSFERWRSYSVPAPSHLEPVSQPTITLNRLNSWSATYSTLSYVGSTLASLRAFIVSNAYGNTELDLVTVTKNVSTSTVSFIIDATSLLQTSNTQTLQLCVQDDNTYKFVFAVLSLPKTSTITSGVTSSRVLRFANPVTVSPGTYSGLVRSSLTFCVVKVGDSSALASLTSVNGLSVAPNNTVSDTFNVQVNIDSDTVFTNAYLRSHSTDAYQLYAYDTNTAPQAFGTPFQIYQPSEISPVGTNSIELNLSNAWSYTIEYSGVDADTVIFTARGSDNTTIITDILSSLVPNQITVTVPSSHPLRQGGSFTIYVEDKYTFTEPWQSFYVPVPSQLLPADVQNLGTLTSETYWRYQFSNFSYSGNVLADLNLFISSDGVIPTSFEFKVNGTKANASVAINLSECISSTSKTYAVYWQDYKTAPVQIATVNLEAASTFTALGDVPPFMSRLNDPDALVAVSYSGSNATFVTLPLPVPRPVSLLKTMLTQTVSYNPYSGYPGLQVTAESNNADSSVKHLSLTIDESVLTNSDVLLTKDTEYQVYGYDLSTNLTAIGTPFKIETPTVLLTTDSSQTFLLGLFNQWSKTIQYTIDSAFQSPETLSFFIEPANEFVVLSRTNGSPPSITIEALSPVREGLDTVFRVYWSDNVTTRVLFRSFSIPFKTVIAPSVIDTEIIPTSSTIWITRVSIQYTTISGLGTQDTRDFFILPGDATSFDILSANVYRPTTETKSDTSFDLVINSLGLVDSTERLFTLWWRDATVDATLYAYIRLYPKSTILVSTPTTTIPVSRFLDSVPLLSVTWSGLEKQSLQFIAIPVGSALTYSGLQGFAFQWVENTESGAIDVFVTVDETYITNEYLWEHQTVEFQTYAYDLYTPAVAVGNPFVIIPPSVISPSKTATPIILRYSTVYTYRLAYTGIDADTAVFVARDTNGNEIPNVLSNTTTTELVISVPQSLGIFGSTVTVWWSDKYTTATRWQQFHVAQQSTLTTPNTSPSSFLFKSPNWQQTYTIQYYSESQADTASSLSLYILPDTKTSYASSDVVANVLTVGDPVRVSDTIAEVSVTINFLNLATDLAGQLTNQDDVLAYNIWFTDANTRYTKFQYTLHVARTTYFETLLQNVKYDGFKNGLLTSIAYLSYDSTGSSIRLVATPTTVSDPNLSTIQTNKLDWITFTYTPVVFPPDSRPDSNLIDVHYTVDTEVTEGHDIFFKVGNIKNWRFVEDYEKEFYIWLIDDFTPPQRLNMRGCFTTRDSIFSLNRNNNWEMLLNYTYYGTNPSALRFDIYVKNVNRNFGSEFISYYDETKLKLYMLTNEQILKYAGIEFYIVFQEEGSATPGQFIFKYFTVDLSINPAPIVPAPSLNTSLALQPHTDTQTTQNSALNLLVENTTDLLYTLKVQSTSFDDTAEGYTLWAYDVNTVPYQITDTVFTFKKLSTITPLAGPSRFLPGSGLILFSNAIYSGTSISSLAFAPCLASSTAYVPSALLQSAITLSHTVSSNLVTVTATIAESIYTLFPDGVLPSFSVWGVDNNTPDGIKLDRIFYVYRENSSLPYTVLSGTVTLTGETFWKNSDIIVTSAVDTEAFALPSSTTDETFDPLNAYANVSFTYTSLSDDQVRIELTVDATIETLPFRVWVQTAADDHVPATRVDTVYTVVTPFLSDIVRLTDVVSGTTVNLLTAVYTGTSIVKFVAFPSSVSLFNLSDVLEGITFTYTENTITAVFDYTKLVSFLTSTDTFTVWAYETASSNVLNTLQTFSPTVPPSEITCTLDTADELVPNNTRVQIASVQYKKYSFNYSLQLAAFLFNEPFDIGNKLSGISYQIMSTTSSTQFLVNIAIEEDFFELNALSKDSDLEIRLVLYDDSTHVNMRNTPYIVPLLTSVWRSTSTIIQRDHTTSSYVLDALYKAGRTLQIEARVNDATIDGINVTIVPSSEEDRYEVLVSADERVLTWEYFLVVSNPRSFRLYGFDSVLTPRLLSNQLFIRLPKSTFTPVRLQLSAHTVFFQKLFMQLSDISVDVVQLAYVAIENSLSVAITEADTTDYVPGTPNIPQLLSVSYTELVSGTLSNGVRNITVYITPSNLIERYAGTVQFRLWFYDNNTTPDIENSAVFELSLASTITGVQPLLTSITAYSERDTESVAIVDFVYTGLLASSLLCTASINGVTLTYTSTLQSANRYAIRLYAKILSNVWALNNVASGTPLSFTVSVGDANLAPVAFDRIFTIQSVFTGVKLLKRNLKVYNDIAVLDLTYTGSKLSSELAVVAVPKVYNTMIPNVTPVIQGISAVVVSSELQWRVWVKVDKSVVTYFTDTVDVLKFSLWIYETGNSQIVPYLLTNDLTVSTEMMIAYIKNKQSKIIYTA